ncbi:hypothetical protein [Paenibacillus sp. sgz500958]|uniref:hypothetical protein n=1 Tax=Paenibacillus sp. sgz500958 TaxID=3242475 RepID=UPI0036D2D7CE
MKSLLLKIKSPDFIFFSSLLSLSIIVALLSHNYFTERVFYISGDMYTYYSEKEDLITYHSDNASPVQVRIDYPDRIVILNDNEYTITKLKSGYLTIYNVTFPDGSKYEVQEQPGTLISFDDQGNLVSELLMFVNNQRVMSEGELLYTPAMLVKAAYPEYHFTRGEPSFLYLALALMIYGWCTLRYEKFQNFLFLISLRWVWVEDPEPSDFYYFMCMVSGIAIMLMAVWVAFQTF